MKQFPRVLSHDLHWETKAYMLKRSIEEGQAFQSLPLIYSNGLTHIFLIGIKQGPINNKEEEQHLCSVLFAIS